MTSDDAIISILSKCSLQSSKSAGVNKQRNQTIKWLSTNLWWLLDSIVFCAKKPFNAKQLSRFTSSSSAPSYSRRLATARRRTPVMHRCRRCRR